MLQERPAMPAGCSLCQPALPLRQVRRRLHQGAGRSGLSPRATASATERLLHAIPERVTGPCTWNCLERRISSAGASGAVSAARVCSWAYRHAAQLTAAPPGLTAPEGGSAPALSTGHRPAGSPCGTAQADRIQTLTAGPGCELSVAESGRGSDEPQPALSDATCRCRPQASPRSPAPPGAPPTAAQGGEALRSAGRCLHGLTAHAAASML